MTIDIQDAKGTLLGLSPTAEEPEDGPLKRLRFKPKVKLWADPVALDQFLDSVQAGTKPSDILWWSGAKGDGKFPRWLGILSIDIAVNSTLEFMLKLATVPSPGQPREDYLKGRIEVAVVVKLKKLTAELSANSVMLELQTEGFPSESEQHLLNELFRREALLVSIYQRQADLVQEPVTPPRGADSAKNDDGKVVVGEFGKGAQKGRKGRKGAEVPKGGADDALFPSVVEHVVTTRRATPPDLQLQFKITEDRAIELLAAMYELEIIGPVNEDRAHEVLWTEAQLKETKDSGASAIPPGGAAADIE